MDYLYIKALHIIFVVTWFSGLFYIVRLFIYHVEANELPGPSQKILQDQFKIMEKRLWYGITWPSAVLTLILGGGLLRFFWPPTEYPWLLAKLLFVLGLFLYHLRCGRIYKNLQEGKFLYTSQGLRVWNEVATLFLFGIVFLVVLKDSLDALKGMASFVLLAFLLFGAIALYKKLRSGRGN